MSGRPAATVAAFSSDAMNCSPRFPVSVSIGGEPVLRAYLADTFLARLRGLHALPPLGPSEALIIRPCNAVQTLTMRIPIEAAFLDVDGRVLTLHRLPPRRMASCRGAVSVMEMVDGTIERLGLREGQRLDIESTIGHEVGGDTTRADTPTPVPSVAADPDLDTGRSTR